MNDKTMKALLDCSKPHDERLDQIFRIDEEWVVTTDGARALFVRESDPSVGSTAKIGIRAILTTALEAKSWKATVDEFWKWAGPNPFADADTKICRECKGKGSHVCLACAGSGEHECDCGHTHDCDKCDGYGNVECVCCVGAERREDEQMPALGRIGRWFYNRKLFWAALIVAADGEEVTVHQTDAGELLIVAENWRFMVMRYAGMAEGVPAIEAPHVEAS